MKQLLSKMQNYNTINVENTINSGQVFFGKKQNIFGMELMVKIF